MGTSLNLSLAFHPQMDGQTERVNQVMEDMLRACVIDFESSWEIHLLLIEFVYNNNYHTSIGMAPFEALYGRPCRSPLCWTEVRDKQLLGPEMIRETSEKIKVVQEKMKTAQTRHKSYADKHCRGLEFKVGDHVFLKVSPVRGIVRFGHKKGKLSPHFIGPFESLERVGQVAYRLALLPKMSGVYDVFHVSMLRRCAHNPAHEIDFFDIEVNNNVTYNEGPVRILDREVKKLRNKEIPLVKIQWKHHGSSSQRCAKSFRSCFDINYLRF